jgi:hypothetical protein
MDMVRDPLVDPYPPHSGVHPGPTEPTPLQEDIEQAPMRNGIVIGALERRVGQALQLPVMGGVMGRTIT